MLRHVFLAAVFVPNMGGGGSKNMAPKVVRARLGWPSKAHIHIRNGICLNSHVFLARFPRFHPLWLAIWSLVQYPRTVGLIGSANNIFHVILFLCNLSYCHTLVCMHFNSCCNRMSRLCAYRRVVEISPNDLEFPCFHNWCHIHYLTGRTSSFSCQCWRLLSLCLCDHYAIKHKFIPWAGPACWPIPWNCVTPLNRGGGGVAFWKSFLRLTLSPISNQFLNVYWLINWDANWKRVGGLQRLCWGCWPGSLFLTCGILNSFSVAELLAGASVKSTLGSFLLCVLSEPLH